MHMPNVPDTPEAQRSPSVDALVEQIVRESHLPSARAQADLRRELVAHFADAAAAGDAVARFGAPDAVATGLRRAYRPWRSALYAAKIVAAVVVSTGIALPLQAAAHLRIAHRATPAGVPSVGMLRLGMLRVGLTPWYGFAARVSLAVILLAVVAWELDIEPACRRLERHPAQLVAAVLGLFAASLVVHAWSGLWVDPGEAFVGAAAMITVWTVSLAIVAHSDRVLLRLLGGTL